MLKDAIDLKTVRRALVVKLRHHGDVLLTSPVFSALKAQAPHVELDALIYRDTEEMLSGHPAISEIFTVDREAKRGGRLAQLGQEWRLLHGLRARRYDLLVQLTESPRGAWLTRLLRTRYAVTRDYRPRRGRFWHAGFTHRYRIPVKPRHTVELHLDALRRIGIQPGAPERRLVLVPGDTAEASVRNLLRENGLAEKSFIHVHPTSRWLFKCWDADKLAALIDALQQAGERVVLTAAPSDTERAYLGRITAQLRNPTLDLSGQLSLKQLAALTAKAKLFIGVDSVPMHIAAAMQTPVVALFGPSGDLEWGPWMVRHRVLTSGHSCRPCGLDGCGNGKVSECLTTLGVDEALAAVRQLLA